MPSKATRPATDRGAGAQCPCRWGTGRRSHPDLRLKPGELPKPGEWVSFEDEEDAVLNMLWDASHLWGYVALHALRAAGVPHRVLKASEIAQEGVSGKALLVPGGGARAKAAALGSAGMEAVRAFVRGGGIPRHLRRGRSGAFQRHRPEPVEAGRHE